MPSSTDDGKRRRGVGLLAFKSFCCRGLRNRLPWHPDCIPKLSKRLRLRQPNGEN